MVGQCFSWTYCYLWFILVFLAFPEAVRGEAGEIGGFPDSWALLILDVTLHGHLYEPSTVDTHMYINGSTARWTGPVDKHSGQAQWTGTMLLAAPLVTRQRKI